MSNGGNGKHDTFFTLMAALGSFCAWLLRFIVSRYFDRKDKAEEKEKQKELEDLLRKDIRKHLKRKGHSPGE